MVSFDARKRTWTLISTGSAVGAGILTRNLLKAGWRSVRHDDPPLNPALPNIRWSDALAWAFACGAAIGVARLLARHGAASGWRRVMNSPPPGLGG